TASFNSNSPSKEYIYAGGRLVATEEPVNSSSSLAAPTNFKATADTEGQIVLSWDPVQDATKYEVHRGSTVSGSFPAITPQNYTNTSYTDSVKFQYNTSILTPWLYKVQDF